MYFLSPKSKSQSQSLSSSNVLDNSAVPSSPLLQLLLRPRPLHLLLFLFLFLFLPLNIYLFYFTYSQCHSSTLTDNTQQQQHNQFTQKQKTPILDSDDHRPLHPSPPSLSSDDVASLSHSIHELNNMKMDLIRHLANSSLISSPNPPSLSSSLPPSPSPTSPSSPPFYLIFGIPTVHRQYKFDYLNTTLHHLSSQLSTDPDDPFYKKIAIFVQVSYRYGEGYDHGNDNTKKNTGDLTITNELKWKSSFDAIEKLYSSHPCQCIQFHRNFHPHGDDNSPPSSPPPPHHNPNIPSPQVEKQTRDIVSLGKIVEGQSSYYMFMEDDFRICDRGIKMILYSIEKANNIHGGGGGKGKGNGWISLKYSFGMNGFLIHNSSPPPSPSLPNDISHFLAYLLRRNPYRPPDHLLAEWSAGETDESKLQKSLRPNVIFRYNLFYHIGVKSSLRSNDNGEFAQCYHEMNTKVVFEVESFKFNECENDDISPCDVRKEKQYKYSISEAEVKK